MRLEETGVDLLPHALRVLGALNDVAVAGDDALEVECGDGVVRLLERPERKSRRVSVVHRRAIHPKYSRFVRDETADDLAVHEATRLEQAAEERHRTGATNSGELLDGGKR